MKQMIQRSLLISLLLLPVSIFAETKLSLTKNELARHSSPDNCWVIIEGTIYDISSAVKDHKRYKYELNPWCGKDATLAWQTKDGLKRAHSRKAQILLKELSLGKVEP